MTPHLSLRGGVYVAVFAGENGQRVRRSTRCTTPEAAQAELARMVREAEQVRAGILPPPEPTKGRDRATLAAMVDRWAESKARKGLTPRYILLTRRGIDKCVRLMRWGSLRSLTPAGMELLRETMLERGISAGVVNSRMAAMGSFTTWLWRTGRIPADPMVDLAPLKSSPIRRRALTPEELHALFNCPKVREQHRRAYAALFYSGLRVDRELARLTWQEVGQDGVLRFVGKRGVQRMVPICEALRGILEAQRASQAMRLDPAGLVFPEGVPDSDAFNADLLLAGIVKVDTRGYVATRHSLRHSFNQELTRAGVTSEQRQHLGGWSDEQMPRHQYQDARVLELKEAVDRLPRMIA